MPDLTPVTKCPKCGSHAIEFAAFEKVDLDDKLTCPTCGHVAAKSEFTTEIVGEVAKLLQDALRNIPGFKAK